MASWCMIRLSQCVLEYRLCKTHRFGMCQSSAPKFVSIILVSPHPLHACLVLTGKHCLCRIQAGWAIAFIVKASKPCVKRRARWKMRPLHQRFWHTDEEMLKSLSEQHSIKCIHSRRTNSNFWHIGWVVSNLVTFLPPSTSSGSQQVSRV